MPGQTPSLTTGTCWPRRSARSRPGSGARSWSASMGLAPATSWSSTCWACPPRAGNWPGGLRWIARRVKPSRRQMGNLTAYEKKTGWRYSIICTNIPGSGIPGVTGSHHPQYIDAAHREHAVVETGGVRTAKAMGLRNLPSKSWQVNRGWVIAANIAADLTAWTRLLGLCDDPGLREADPDTLRYRVWHIPARLARHARERVLKISPDWPWKDAFLTCWRRLCALPAPADQHQPPQRHQRRHSPARSEPVRTRAHRAPSHGHPRQPNRHHTRNRAPAQSVTGPQRR